LPRAVSALHRANSAQENHGETDIIHIAPRYNVDKVYRIYRHSTQSLVFDNIVQIKS
jgi:hypothetical protein